MGLLLAGAAGPSGADPGGGPAAPATPPDPAGTLALSQVLGFALASSPELAPFAWELRAEEARAFQAGRLPNPKAEVIVEDVLGSGEFRGGRRAQVTLQLGQLVELGGKRAARVAAADRMTDVTRADYEARRVEVLADATARFVDVLERQRTLDLAREAVRLDGETLELVRRRTRAGAGSPLDEQRAAAALGQSRLSEEDARHELAVARLALAASWGARAARFDRAKGDLLARQPVPPWEDLERRLAVSPEIVRATSEARLREAERRLAEAKRIPDVTLSMGPRRYEGPGEHAFVFGVSVPLPVFDRNQGGIVAADARVAETRARRHAKEVRLHATLFRLQQELLHASHVLDLLEREVLPATEQALVISREGFERGRFSHLELLDAERAYLDGRRRRIAAAASFHRFALEIERVTGAPLTEERR